jgi:undecaprenyl-diphosphatase
MSGGVMLSVFGPLPLILGFLAAFVSAILAVQSMVSWLRARGLGVFAWWRIAMAAAVVVMLGLGWL